MTNVFLLDVESNAQVGDVTSKKPSKGKDGWAKIKAKSRINLDLGKEKIDQLWDLLMGLA
jgi:hypothetical protein